MEETGSDGAGRSARQAGRGCVAVLRNSCEQARVQQCQINKRERCELVPAVKCGPPGPPVTQCSQVERRVCGPAPREECREVPRRDCTELLTQRCEARPSQACRAVTRQVCRQIPRQVGNSGASTVMY